MKQTPQTHPQELEDELDLIREKLVRNVGLSNLRMEVFRSINEAASKGWDVGFRMAFRLWLSSFNTDSATECFTAVQRLKEKMKDA